MSGPVVLTGVVSRTHLLYAASWLREQRRRGEEATSITVRSPHAFLGRVRVSDDDCREILGEVVDRPVEVHPDPLSSLGPRRGRLTLLCIGAPALRQVLPAVTTGRALPRIVVVDEGIGSYGDWATRAAAHRRAGNAPWWATIRAGAVTLGRRALTGEAWTTYERGPHGWRVNAAVAAEFRTRLTGDSPPAGTAVLLTQPWPDLGVISEGDYRAHVERVAQHCADAGLELTVRLHPGDEPRRYRGLRAVQSDLPAELDRSVSGADVVLGASSTALLNVSAFYGTRCLRVRPPQLAAIDADLSRDQAAVLRSFLPASVPDDELSEILIQPAR